MLLPFTVVLFLLLTSGSKLIAMKVIAFLILPSGFLWIVGLVMACWPGLGWKTRSLIAALWILYACAGSPYVGNVLLRSLEKPLYSFETPEEKIRCHCFVRRRDIENRRVEIPRWELTAIGF